MYKVTPEAQDVLYPGCAPEFEIIGGVHYLPDRITQLKRNCALHSVSLNERMKEYMVEAVLHSQRFYIFWDVKTTVGYNCDCLWDANRQPPYTHYRDCPTCTTAQNLLERRLLNQSTYPLQDDGTCSACLRFTRIVRHHAHMGVRRANNPINGVNVPKLCRGCNRSCGTLLDDYRQGGLLEGLQVYADMAAPLKWEYFQHVLETE